MGQEDVDEMKYFIIKRKEDVNEMENFIVKEK